jgi:hypothetical protein
MTAAQPPSNWGGGAYELTPLPGGILQLELRTATMHLDEARPLCDDLEDASAGDAVRLLVDMGRIGLATPAAAFHGFRTVRRVPIAAVAMVHARPAMRRVASAVMRAGPRFRFFDSREEAIAWLHGAGGEPAAAKAPAPPPASRRRAGWALAGATVVAGGFAAVRMRNRRNPGRRRGPPARARPRLRR